MSGTDSEVDSIESYINSAETMPRNSVSVESPYGVRSFALRFGDVTLAPDSVLVVPTHADESIPPDGVVLKVASHQFGIDFNKTEKIVSGRRGLIGTYRVAEKGKFPGEEVLLVRIPGKFTARRAGADRLELLSEALWSLFGSLAALELRKSTLTSLAMPLLAATRGYEIRELLELLIRHSLAWLRVARHMNSVNFYLVDPGALSKWDAAMDEVLGRHSIDAAQNALVGALRSEILSLLNSSRVTSFPLSWKEITDELRSSFHPKSIPLERVAVAARRFTELVVVQLLVDLSETPKGSLGTQIEALKSRKVIAPWVLAHLDCLKLFGNAAAHSNQTVASDPPSLREDDLVGLLASLQRVIEFSIKRASSPRMNPL